MDPYSNEHDVILRSVASTTGMDLDHWFDTLERAGIASKGFLAGLELLRDRLNVPHAHATAITYAFLNPSMVPEDVLPPSSASDEGDEEIDEDEDETESEPAPPHKATGRAAKASPEPRRVETPRAVASASAGGRKPARARGATPRPAPAKKKARVVAPAARPGRQGQGRMKTSKTAAAGGTRRSSAKKTAKRTTARKKSSRR